MRTQIHRLAQAVQEQVYKYDRNQSDPLYALKTNIGNCAAKAVIFSREATDTGVLDWNQLHILHSLQHGVQKDFQNPVLGNWSKKPDISHVTTLVTDTTRGHIWGVDFDLDKSGFWIERRDVDDGTGTHLVLNNGQPVIPAGSLLEGKMKLTDSYTGLPLYLALAGVECAWTQLNDLDDKNTDASQVVFDQDF
jgi:hypothetical protein